MAGELAQFLREWRKETPYGKPTDWVFASAKTHGRTPRVGHMIAADHLRLAAIKAGVKLKPGQRFGFHNLRHSLSSLLILGQKADLRTTREILCHAKVTTTPLPQSALKNATRSAFSWAVRPMLNRLS